MGAEKLEMIRRYKEESIFPFFVYFSFFSFFSFFPALTPLGKLGVAWEPGRCLET